MAKKKKKPARKPKRVGKFSKLGILDTWAKLFAENKKAHLTDSQILTKMKLEFPGYAAKSKISSNVRAHRRFYNQGRLPGGKPKVQSKEYERRQPN